MRILHLAPYYPPDHVGGVGEVARSLHEALLARGHTSEVATRGRGAAPGVHRIARSRLGWFLATLAWTARAARADVVHCHSGEALPVMLALRLWPRRRARVLLTLHVCGAEMARAERPYALEGRRFAGARPARRLLLALHRAVDAAALRAADAVATVSSATAHELLGAAGAARARVIHNGVAPPTGPETPGAAPVELLYAGVAGPRKRVAALAFALRHVRERLPDARLRLAGFELADEPALAEVFRGAGVQGAVECVGRLGPAALAAQYRAASVLVLPSAYEGLPLVLLEAMQQGTPVVATRVGGNAEAVLDGETGLLVPADAPDALARACLRLLEDPALARRMGDAARAHVRERFGLEAQVERHLACYAELGASR